MLFSLLLTVGTNLKIQNTNKIMENNQKSKAIPAIIAGLVTGCAIGAFTSFLHCFNPVLVIVPAALVFALIYNHEDE